MSQRNIIVTIIISVLIVAQIAFFAFRLGQEKQSPMSGLFEKSSNPSMLGSLGKLVPNLRKSIECTGRMKPTKYQLRGSKVRVISDSQSMLVAFTDFSKIQPDETLYQLYTDEVYYPWVSKSGTYKPTSPDPNEPFKSIKLAKNCDNKGLDLFSQMKSTGPLMVELLGVDTNSVQKTLESFADEVKCETIGMHRFAPPSNVSFDDACSSIQDRMQNKTSPHESVPDVQPQPPVGLQNNF